MPPNPCSVQPVQCHRGAATRFSTLGDKAVTCPTSLGKRPWVSNAVAIAYDCRVGLEGAGTLKSCLGDGVGSSFALELSIQGHLKEWLANLSWCQPVLGRI